MTTTHRYAGLSAQEHNSPARAATCTPRAFVPNRRRRISLQIAAIPPGAWGKTHKHDSHESAIYVLSGDAGMWREKLENQLVAHAGDFVYVPAGIPHLPYNLSDDDYCVALVARTDQNDQESLVLLPGLDRQQRP